MASSSIPGIYNFSDSSDSSGPSRLFKEGVKAWYMQDESVFFRFLPAHNIASLSSNDNAVFCNDLTSYMPFRAPNAPYHPNAWLRKIYYWPSIGHGTVKDGGAVSILSPYSASNQNYCPVSALYAAAARSTEWKYLTETVLKDPSNPRSEVATYPAIRDRYAGEALIFNVLRLDQQSSGHPEIGVMRARSAMNSLLGGGRKAAPEQGLINMPNPTVTDAQLLQNPAMRWGCGDITDPRTGFVMHFTKTKAPGDPFPSYRVSVMLDGNGRAGYYPIGDEILKERILLHNLYDIFNYQSEGEIIQSLYQVFTGRSPVSGRHEYCLLHEVFSTRSLDFPLPEIPAPAAITTAGWGVAAAQQQQPQQQQPQQPAWPQPPQGGGHPQHNYHLTQQPPQQAAAWTPPQQQQPPQAPPPQQADAPPPQWQPQQAPAWTPPQQPQPPPQAAAADAIPLPPMQQPAAAPAAAPVPLAVPTPGQVPAAAAAAPATGQSSDSIRAGLINRFSQGGAAAPAPTK